MALLEIKKAVRGQSKSIIGIAGTSGSGKTLTALLIARGMVKDASEIGFLDTENKRGSFYADALDTPFMIGDLYPPFSPKRYSDAIKEFQAAGIKVLIIDSITHEWEGEGGCDDIAQSAIDAGKKMANWISAKREHKAFMNTLLQCNMHIIACIRAREKTDFKNPKEPISLGIQPVCEKNFMFEMTASFLMLNEGKQQQFIKIPSFLRKAFGNGDGYLGIDTGKEIIKWINQGEAQDPEIARIKSEMLLACEFGVEAIATIWNGITAEQKKVLAFHKEMCKESALAYEKQAKEASEFDDDDNADKANKAQQATLDLMNKKK